MLHFLHQLVRPIFGGVPSIQSLFVENNDLLLDTGLMRAVRQKQVCCSNSRNNIMLYRKCQMHNFFYQHTVLLFLIRTPQVKIIILFDHLASLVLVPQRMIDCLIDEKSLKYPKTAFNPDSTSQFCKITYPGFEMANFEI